jgi:hypothetical protein
VWRRLHQLRFREHAGGGQATAQKQHVGQEAASRFFLLFRHQ